MTRHDRLAIACAALVAVSVMGTVTIAARAPQAADPAAADAAKASPELVGELSKELGSTPEQAAGAAGALFGIAKNRLKADEFSQVSKAVPGMDSLLKAAPKQSGGKSNPLEKAQGLASAASMFSKLGLKPSMVAKAVPVLTKFVSKGGGDAVGKLLAGALK